MEKRNRNAGHRYSLKYRILAWAMVFFVTLTMIPYDSLVVHAASTTSVKDIESIETDYEVDYGTSKGEIGLPDELPVVLETVTAVEGATNGESKVSEDTADKAVVWEGNYNGEKAGTYALTAKFKDKSLQYDDDDMPTVYVTVREPETPEPETPEVENSEDEDEGDDDEEADQQEQSEDQNEEQDDQQAVEQDDQQPEDQDDQQVEEQVEEQPEEQVEEQPEEQAEEEQPEEQVEEQQPEEQVEEQQPEEQVEPEVVIEEEVEQTEQKDAAKSPQPDDTITGREEANLNEFGLHGHNNMRATVTHMDGSPITEDNPLKAFEEFKMTLEFWETPGGIQFDMDTLTYTMPSGLTCLATHTGESEVNLLTADGDQLTLTTTFTVDKSVNPNKIYYPWNHAEGDPDNTYERLCTAENVSIKISTVMCVGDNGGEVTFEDGTSVPVDLSVKITVIKENQVNGDHVIQPSEKEEMVFAIFEGDGTSNVRAKDKDGNVIPTFTYADMTDQGNNQAKKEFSGLVKGTYTVKEISTLAIPDYTFSSSSITAVTEDIPASDERTFHLKNIYVQDSGNLVLKKNFASGSALNGSNMTTAQRQKITFLVTGPNGFNHTYTYDQIYSNGGALTLSDLPVGTYHVVESSNITGYDWESHSYEVKVDGTSTGSGDNNAEVAVEKDKESEVTYTNKYKQQTGSLKLTKAFEGDALTDALKSQITFTITGPNGYSRTVTYAEIESGSVTITDLPIGNYTITENRGNIPTGVLAQTYINGGSTESTNLQATASVTNGGTATATYRNKYTKVGSLKIIKKVTGDRTYANFIGKSSKATVTVQGPNGYSRTITMNSSNFGSSRGTYTIDNLPIGNYTVTESNAGISSYTVTTTYDGTVSGSGTSTPGTSAVTQGTTAEITVNNHYERNKGTIKIKKTLSGDITSLTNIPEEYRSKVWFVIKQGNTTVAQVTLQDMIDGNGEVTVPVNTSSTAYTIQEINADIANYLRTTTVTLDGSSASNPATATVSTTGQSHEVVFNNKYTRTGKLKLNKTVLGLEGAAATELRAQLRFEILDESGAVVTVNGKTEFTLEEMIAGIDLPVGNYRVREKNDIYHPEIYTHSSDTDVWSMLVPDGGEIDRTYGLTSALQAVTYGNETYVYFWNEYHLVGVGVTLVKYVIINGQAINTDDPDHNPFTQEQERVENLVKNSIRFYIYEGSNTSGTLFGVFAYRESSITPEEAAAGVRPISVLAQENNGLEPGKTYTIEEKHYEVANYTASILFQIRGSIDGGLVESRNHQATFKVLAGGVITIDVTNGYEGYGNLEVKKGFGSNSQLNDGNLTQAQKEAIQFTVTGYKNDAINDDGTPQQGNSIVFGPQTFSYAEMTDEDGDGIFSKKFEQIHTGVYIVKETNAEGIDTLYNCVTTRDPDGNIVVTLGGEQSVTFTNTYTRRLGDLVVKKTFAGDPLNTDNCDLTKMLFHVYDPDGNEIAGSPVNYVQLSELPNAEWKIEDLPTGTYTVKEEGADYNDQYYERTTTVKVNGGGAEAYSDENGVSGAVTDDGPLTVELINTYKEVGALIFNKSFIDDEAINKLTDDQKASVAFTVKDSAGGTIATITYAQIKEAVDAGEPGYKILVDAPADYTIIESADFAGYERTTTVTVNAQSAEYDETTGVAAHVEKFTSSTVDFVNEYKEAGKLTVTKNIQYTGDLTVDQMKEFTFTVTGPDGEVLKDADGNLIGIFNYYDMTRNDTGKIGTKTFENLPAGQYHIKEEILHDGGTDDNPYYGLVRTTTIQVGSVTTSDVEADFDVTKDDVVVTVTNRYDDVPPLTVVKREGGYPVETVAIDGMGYPVWKFTLDISNLSVATTDNGMTEILDTYDVLFGDGDLGVRPEYFRTLTAAEAESYLGDANANKLIPEDENGNVEGVTVTITENGTDGSTIKIEGVSESTTPHHMMTFYLIPKDANSLGLLNLSDEMDEAEEGSTEVIKSFNNNIKYKELPLKDWTTQKTPVEYNYRYQVLQKKAINYDAERKCFFNPDKPTQIVNYALYEVVMNEDANWIGDLSVTQLDCEDEFSTNQYVDETSVKFFRYNGTEDDPEEVNINWTISGHKISFKIDNGKRYVMRYRAEVLFTQEDLHTTMEVWNKFTMAGKWVEPHPEYVPESLGDASEDYIKLRKSDRYAANVGLEGAVFALYHSVADAEADENNENYLGLFTTGADGTVTIQKFDPDGDGHYEYVYPGDWALKEIEAPPGFGMINYIVQVHLANRLMGETADPEHYIYLPTTAVGVKDTPYEGVVELGALKNLIGSNLDLAAGDYEFVLTGENGAPTGTAASDEEPAPTDPVKKTNDANGKARFGQIAFRTTDLDPIKEGDEIVGYEKTFSYTIKETKGDIPGITYDETVHTVEVTVTSNDETNKLDVVVKIDGRTATAGENDVYFINFGNEYTAEGSLVLGAKKTIAGRKLRVEEFTFELALNDSVDTVISAVNAEGNVYDCDIVFPQIDYILQDSSDEGHMDTTLVEVVDGKYKVYIDPDVMNKTDGDGHRYVDYQYTVTEARNDQLQGITFDTTEYDITVRVTDLDDGNLRITVLRNGTIITEFFSHFKFKNYYNAEGQAKPEGKKFVEDDEQALAAGTYEFNVYNLTNGSEELIGTVTHSASSSGSAGAAINYPTIKAVVKPTATEDELGMKVVTGNDGHVKEIIITHLNYEEFENEEFKFKFNEMHGGEIREGIQYSDASYEVTATVTMNSSNDSVLDVNLSKTEELDFINTPMGAEGQAQPSGTKVLNGRNLREGEFTFILYYGTKEIGHVTNAAGGQIKYPVIKFVLDAAGTEGVTVDDADETTLVTITVRNPGKLVGPYEFTVKEDSSNPTDGIVYPLYPDDRKTFTATAKMKEGSNEEIEVTLNNADALDFINTYGAEGEDTDEGEKVLEGRDLRAGEFWFAIKDADGVEIGRVTNELNGKIPYPTFKYVVDPKATAGRKLETSNGVLTAVIITVNKAEDLAGTEYKVTEIEQSEDGVVYDTTTEQKITVTVSVDTEDESKLIVNAEAEEGKVFTNTFSAGGQAKPEGYKELTNRLPELGEFKFDIKEGDSVIATVESTDDLNSEQNKKKINYPTFRYTVDAAVDAGTTYDKDTNTITVNVQDIDDIASPYTYTVKEVVPEGATETSDGKYIYKGVTYDLTVITLKVTVEQDLDDKSRLIVTINKSTGNDFKNEYETVGGLELTAEKTLLGRILNSGDFEFELKDDKGNVLQTKANVGNTITFDPIKYTQDDMDRDDHGFIKDTVKNYSVNEVIPAGATQTSDGRYVYNGVTYSTKSYKIKVSLKDDKEGNIIVTVEDEFDNIIEAILAKYKFVNAFENFYDAVGEGTFEGHKTLKGREITEDDEETVFTFKIEIDGKEFTLTNTGTQIQYPKLKFVVDSSLAPGTVIKPAWEDDSHKAIVIRAADLENIIEVVDANADPVEYKEKAYEYKVTEETGSAAGITYDTQEYTVTAIVNLNASDNGKLDVEVKTDPEGDVDFVNTYRARGEATTEGNKFLYGRIIVGNEFTFNLEDENGKVIGTVGNEASGVIQYPVFRYVVDPDAQNLGLTTEEDANGNLTAVIKTYASKEDLEKDLKATYTVKEVTGNEPGITYDGTTIDTIKVTVAVTKEEIEEGVAKLDVTLEKDPEVAFTNYYKARGEKQISGYKHLTNRLPVDEEFEFVIYEVAKDDVKANKEICRVKSTTMLNADEDAVAINYPTFRYIVDYTAEPGTVYDRDNNVIIVTVNWVEDLEGGFEYLITEVDDGKDYFTYDTTEISLYVNVTATGVEIEPHVEKLNVAIEDSEGNDFYNEYHAKGALQLYAEKTLLGRILNSGDFTFALNRTDETFENVIEELDTKTNTKDGSITFDLIEYDIDKDSLTRDAHGFAVDTNYYYTVSEVVPAGAVENEDGTYTYNGVTYDPTVFHITAKLHDNKHGLIEVTVEAVPEGELTFLEELKLYEFKFGNAFVNFYHAEGENTISGTKMLRGRELQEGEYQFTIKDEDGNVLATVSNKADGTINYPVFRYVVNHLADGTSYSYDETNNTLTLTTNNLEDMVTPVMTAGVTEPTDDGEPEETDEKVGYAPKDYIYTIDEVIPEGAVDNGDGTYTYKGVTYNELGVHYTLTVTVEVNADDMGILDVTMDNPEGFDFSNAYRASGEDTFTGKKILKNDDVKNYEGVFQFKVTDSEGNEITTVSSDKDANILYPTFRYVVDPDAEAGAVYDEKTNVYTVTVNAYEDLADVYKYNVTEVEPTTEEKEKNEALYNMLFNTGDFTEYEISITVVANEEDASILDVVALPNKEVDFVNTFYHKAGLYKVSKNSGEALKGAVIRLVRVDDNTIVDEWTSDGTVHMINLIDLGEGTFRFVEVKSPSGYNLAKSIEFTQDKDGVLTSPYDHIYDKDGNAIFVMYDPKNSTTGDNAPIAAAGGAFAVGLAGLAAVLASKKKRRI